MSNKGLWGALVVCAGVAGGALVGGLDGLDGLDDSKVSSLIAEHSGYRLAASGGPSCPATWECPVVVLRNATCLCLTKEVGRLQGEVALPPDATRKAIQICRRTSGKKEFMVRSVRPSQATAPVGFTCRTIVGDTLLGNTFPGIQTDIEEALAAQCGLPVTSQTWYCCPHCLMFANGCPPCAELCPYWEAWRGHESECPVGVVK